MQAAIPFIRLSSRRAAKKAYRSRRLDNPKDTRGNKEEKDLSLSSCTLSSLFSCSRPVAFFSPLQSANILDPAEEG